ncbi:MAG: 2-oxoacid:ferredoxin oxidoreductase subunit beta, partial [Leptonema sp. (in: Bacteria)]|nr:2-oxoacid:ferredoxin oxidoreductase subunit beta [Leptonema sp. (in: bacteria)]
VVSAAKHAESVTLFDEENPAFLDAFIHSEGNPEIPTGMGVLYAKSRPVYETEVRNQKETIGQKRGPADLHKLLYSGETWQIE